MLFIVLLFSVAVIGQEDSLWHKSITLRYASESITSTGKPFKVTSLEMLFQKSPQTIVPIVNFKTIHGLKGSQFGLSYYRKWNWGYVHGSGFYSKSRIFPHWMVKSTAFITVSQGLTSNFGMEKIAYAESVDLHLLNIGATYYYHSLMMSYQYRKPISGFGNHRLKLRRFLNNPKDHIELSVYKGLDIEGLDPSVNRPIELFAFQCSIQKYVSKKIQLQLSMGIVSTKNNTSNNRLVNYSVGLKKEI